MFRFCFLLILFIIARIEGNGQTAAGKLKSSAVKEYNNKNYLEAIRLMEEYLKHNPTNKEINRMMGFSYFNSNKLTEASIFLTAYYKDEPKDLEAVYTLAKTAQHALKFNEAIQFYKYYLSLCKSSDPLYRSIIADIKRCNAGSVIVYQEQDALVENFGIEVNSIGDEMNPLWSPNHNGRVYFSSNQVYDTSDQIKDKLIPIKNKEDFNLYGTLLFNGMWSRIYPLNLELNTAYTEKLFGFNEDGKVVIFGRGGNLKSLKMYADSLDQNEDNSLEFRSWPIAFDPYVRDIYVYNDSSILFSSIRPEGFGGYDIYLVERRGGVWNTPKNLGSRINSAYDEVTPYLALDGRTLYLSSNGLNSMGGFDVFKFVFNDKKLSWEDGFNLGLPINSAGNDEGYALNKDGLSAVFSSDRKTGSIGGYDLFSAFFSSIRPEQNQEHKQIIFTEIEKYKLSSKEYQEELKQTKITNLTIEHIFYTSDESIKQQNNLKYLNSLIELGKRFPGIYFNFLGHTANSTSPEVDLYFGIKKTEQIAKYMINNGIEASRINLQSVGNHYPIAKNVINGKESISGQGLNRRITTLIYNVDSLPVNIVYKEPHVNEILKTPEGSTFDKKMNGLTYRIQLVTLKQMYKGDLTSFSNDLLIESQGESGLYKYLVGLFTKYNDASALLKDVKQRGIDDAYIVPYIGGKRVVKSQINEDLVKKYPDLQYYWLN